MEIAFWYALIVGLAAALLVILGCTMQRPRLLIGGMIASAVVASPVVTFTRGTAGAIYASDLVSLVLIFCYFLPSTKALLRPVAIPWYHSFRALVVFAMVSALIV